MRKRFLSLALCASLLTGITATATGCSTTADSDRTDVSESTEESETETEEEVVIEEFADMTAEEIVADIRVGWNLGNSFDSVTEPGLLILTAETHWGNPITTEEMIDAVYEAGFNAIRIPVTWGSMTTTVEPYTINTIYLERVKAVVDYAIDNDMYVILNMHHEEWIDLESDTMTANLARYNAMWTQIAEEFKGYDEHLIFEGLNEPRQIGSATEWTGGTESAREYVNHFTAAFVKTVRATGGNNDRRLLMIPGYAASSAEVALAAIKVPDDDMVAVSVHAYIPYNFALANPGTSEWDPETGTGDIDTLMNHLDKYFISQGTPVILGEFGAMNKENEAERCEWVDYYLTKADEYNVACFWWDNNAFEGDGENFGLLNRRTLEWEYPELLDAIMTATEPRVQ